MAAEFDADAEVMASEVDAEVEVVVAKVVKVKQLSWRVLSGSVKSDKFSIHTMQILVAINE